MKQLWLRLAKFSSSTPIKIAPIKIKATESSLARVTAAVLFSIIFLSACGTGSYDISNSTDRAAMKDQINIDLTNNDCVGALTLATELYQSSYSDNDTRMLYASAQACNVGIQLFDLLDSIGNADFSTPDKVFRSLVKLFPSTASDSSMQSSWFAQDALQTILNPGVVVAPADQINFTSFNPGSDSINDRTLDSSSYLMFVGMSVIGTGLNRYGYAPGQTGASTSYARGQDLPWITTALVQSDTSGAACAIASGLFNLFDGITAVGSYLSGATSSQLQIINADFQTLLSAANTTFCVTGFTAAQCAAAEQRLRYRGACAEQPAAAAFTAGIVNGINAAWATH